MKKSLWVFLAACVMLASAGIASAQASYSVVAVMPDGTVVLRGPSGVRSYQVPAGTMFTADGKADVAVADLRPGMKVTGMESNLANWHGSDVMVHEELNAEVVAKAGNSMMIRGSKGVEKYTWKDASEITIVKDGKVVDASAINVGDRITGMVVQKAVHKPMAAARLRRPRRRRRRLRPTRRRLAAQEGGGRQGSGGCGGQRRPRLAAPARRPTRRLQSGGQAGSGEEAPQDGRPSFRSSGFAGLLALGAGAGLTAIRKSRSAK